MSKLTLILAAGALVACSSAPRPDTSHEADLVYAALLNERHDSLQVRLVLVNAKTIDGLAPVAFDEHDPEDRLNYIQQELPGIGRATLEDYERVNPVTRQLDSLPGFTVPHRVRAVTDRDRDSVLHLAAQRASIDQPTGIVALSRVGFDPSRTQAVLYAEFFCGPECGHGEYVLLTKVDGQWRVEDSATLFVA